MVDDKPLVVTSTALWQLHEDVLRLFEEVNYIRLWLKAFPYDSPEFCKWAEAHEDDLVEWSTKYPDAAERATSAREALEPINNLVDLADRISECRALFWFARSHLDSPSDWGVFGRGNASRHEDAFAASEAYLSELLDVTSKGKDVNQQLTEVANLFSTVKAAQRCHGGVLFLYAPEVPSGLRYEAALAVKLSEPTSGSDGLQAPEFIPTTFQSEILIALCGRALKKHELAAEVCDGNSSKLYKKNTAGVSPLRELMEQKLVANKPGLGYFRPDAPPTPTAAYQVPPSGPELHPK